MGDTTLETIDELLAGAVRDTDDPEAHYKINSARQLLEVIRQRHVDLDEAVDETATDAEILDTLRELGYVD
ncbi:hypothetical protein [Halobellus rufus]|uniref:hypothetical protein n=1 Tax=Halobellus rufus TaxID=1448860 RepID=UPI0006796BF9|nr:hypothetical protein [Halobellus rufus]